MTSAHEENNPEFACYWSWTATFRLTRCQPINLRRSPRSESPHQRQNSTPADGWAIDISYQERGLSSMNNISFVASAILVSIASFVTLFAFQVAMFSQSYIFPLLGYLASSNAQNTDATATKVSVGWHAPNASQINDLGIVLNGTGVYGFTFNGSGMTVGNNYYGGYNWYIFSSHSKILSILATDL